MKNVNSLQWITFSVYKSNSNIKHKQNMFKVTFLILFYIFKGAVYDSNPIHFLSNSENISSLSASFPVYVFAEKKVLCSYTTLAL